jgi:hypothetical protein
MPLVTPEVGATKLSIGETQRGTGLVRVPVQVAVSVCSMSSAGVRGAFRRVPDNAEVRVRAEGTRSDQGARRWSRGNWRSWSDWCGCRSGWYWCRGCGYCRGRYHHRLAQRKHNRRARCLRATGRRHFADNNQPGRVRDGGPRSIDQLNRESLAHQSQLSGRPGLRIHIDNNERGRSRRRAWFRL